MSRLLQKLAIVETIVQGIAHTHTYTHLLQTIQSCTDKTRSNRTLQPWIMCCLYLWAISCCTPPPHPPKKPSSSPSAHTRTRQIAHFNTCVSTWSLNKPPQPHIILIYGLNLSMNSVQPRGKQETTTANSQSPATLSYFHHRRVEKQLPVASITLLISLLSNCYYLYVSSFFFGSPVFVASSEAEPSCDIVSHCGITSLASLHEHAEDTEEVTSATCILFCDGLQPLHQKNLL